MADPNSKKTFWEKLGQGVAQGWEKAKDASARLGEFASLKLDIKGARDHLEGRYTRLGRTAADRMIDRQEAALDGSDPAVRALLDEIIAAREALAALEKKLADSGQPAEDQKKE